MFDDTNAKVIDEYPLILDGPTLETISFPVAEPYVGSWLCAGFISMVYGKTGIGKTWFSMPVAMSIAQGRPIMGWEVPEKRRVMYFDAEVDPAEINDRLFTLSGGGIPPEFNLCSGLRMEGGLPPLDDEDAQAWYLDIISRHNIEVVVFDNLCTILTSQSISEDDTWLPVQPFLNELRRRRVAVILVHHAGKRGDYLGSSRMTQNMNTVIKLERPQSYDPRSGAVFSIEFQKARSVVGEGAGGASVKLVEGEDGRLDWEILGGGGENTLEQFADALKSEQYATQQELAEALGISQASVSGLVQKARRAGYLENDETKETFKRVKARRKNEEKNGSLADAQDLDAA